MSGFEIVGVILGGLPIACKIAEEYKKGFEPLVKWKRYQCEFRRFVNDVDIERQMFAALIDRLLEYTNLSVEQKQRLLNGGDKDGGCWDEVDKALRVRLGDSFDACKFLLSEMNDDLVKLQNMLSLKDGSVDWVKPGEDRWHYQRKRIAHSFSKKGPETIASLNKNNRRLRDLLDVLDERVATGKPQHRKAISVDTTWANIFACIRRQAISLHGALRNGWKCTCSSPHLASLRLQQRSTPDWTSQFILMLDASRPSLGLNSRKFIVGVKGEKKVENALVLRPQPGPLQESYLHKLKSNIEISNTSEVHLKFYNEFDPRSKSSPATKTSLKKALKTPYWATSSENHSSGLQCSNNDQMTITKGKGKKVVRIDVPAVTHSQSTPDLNTLQTHVPIAIVEEATIEIADLCSRLASCDKTCSYLGYLPCPENHHHEFRSLKDSSKASQQSTADLITLEALLDNSQKLRLTRKQRLRLTVVLASSLLQLQTTPWIAGKLSKKDIFFEYSGKEVFSEHPYIHQSFASTVLAATLDEVPTTSQTPIQVRRLTRSSLTSLGILLLELCFASPIEAQHDIRDHHLVNGQPHNDTDYMTALDWIADIETQEGETYMNAVRACFEFEGKPDWNDSAFIAGIHARVVKGLETMLDDLGWGDEEPQAA